MKIKHTAEAVELDESEEAEHRLVADWWQIAVAGFETFVWPLRPQGSDIHSIWKNDVRNFQDTGIKFVPAPQIHLDRVENINMYLNLNIEFNKI